MSKKKKRVPQKRQPSPCALAPRLSENEVDAGVGVGAASQEDAQ